MLELRALAELANERLARYLHALDPAIRAHRVEFSTRITESWALIYYRRRLIRLSPYVFLLDTSGLAHGSHWRELDATLRHEAAHAYAFHVDGDTAHTPTFRAALARLGLVANGSCDLGPENLAFRYVYGCPTCGSKWHRRSPLKGNWSCGGCAPGRFDRARTLALLERRDLARDLDAARPRMIAALAEGIAARVRGADAAQSRRDAVASSVER